MTVSMTGCSADSVLDKLLSVTDPKPDKKTEATKEDSSDKKDSAGEKEVAKTGIYHKLKWSGDLCGKCQSFCTDSRSNYDG